MHVSGDCQSNWYEIGNLLALDRICQETCQARSSAFRRDIYLWNMLGEERVGGLTDPPSSFRWSLLAGGFDLWRQYWLPSIEMFCVFKETSICAWHSYRACAFFPAIHLTLLLWYWYQVVPRYAISHPNTAVSPCWKTWEPLETFTEWGSCISREFTHVLSFSGVSRVIYCCCSASMFACLPWDLCGTALVRRVARLWATWSNKNRSCTHVCPSGNYCLPRILDARFPAWHL